VLDTETTGFTGEIIELALVDRDGKTLFEERIRPHCRTEPGALAVHKIQDGHLAALPRLDHHWLRLRPLLLEHTVVIYNKAFDVGRLGHNLKVATPAWRADNEQQRDPRSSLTVPSVPCRPMPWAAAGSSCRTPVRASREA